MPGQVDAYPVPQAEPIVYTTERDMRRFDSHIRASCTHRDTDICLGEGRGVVYAVADHKNGMSLCLIFLHDVDLVFR